MGLKTFGNKGIETYNSTLSEQDKQNEERKKLVNELTLMRENIIRKVKNRLPMKGIDIIIKQAFDETVVKNLEGIKKLLLGAIHGETKTIKTPKEDTEKQLESSKTLKKTSSPQHKPEIDISQKGFPALKERDNTEVSPQRKSGSYVLNEKELRKKIDQLILEIKIRDKKLREKEKEIEALRKSLEILEQQNMPPFVESWGVDGSYGEEEIKQLQDRVKRWEIIWQKMKPLFGRDPKFKTLFILQRLGSISIRNLSQALGLDTNYTTTILRELQESGFVRVEGTVVRINTGL